MSDAADRLMGAFGMRPAPAGLPARLRAHADEASDGGTRRVPLADDLREAAGALLDDDASAKRVGLAYSAALRERNEAQRTVTDREGELARVGEALRRANDTIAGLLKSRDEARCARDDYRREARENYAAVQRVRREAELMRDRDHAANPRVWPLFSWEHPDGSDAPIRGTGYANRSTSASEEPKGHDSLCDEVSVRLSMDALDKLEAFSKADLVTREEFTDLDQAHLELLEKVNILTRRFDALMSADAAAGATDGLIEVTETHCPHGVVTSRIERRGDGMDSGTVGYCAKCQGTVTNTTPAPGGSGLSQLEVEPNGHAEREVRRGAAEEGSGSEG